MKPPEPPAELEALLEYLKRTRGFDFAAYKHSSLMRRILKRMQIVGISTFNDYVDHLEVHPEEFAFLFNTILINVTGFFRDPAAWEYLGQEIVPRICKNIAANGLIRVWSAGVASGEEAYSLAMLLAEELGVENFRSRVKIYATDVDEEALTQARLGTYMPRDIEDVPESLRERYFERVAAHYVFHKDLRRSVIFGRHDLVQDAPISRISLLVCRNTLMYFNNETQGRILNRFHYALLELGYLFLGKAEMLLTHTSLFAPVDLKRRIFTRVPNHGMRAELLPRAEAGPETVEQMVDSSRMREMAFEIDPVAQLIVDPSGHLTLANERARSLFGIQSSDLGRTFHDLEVSFRPTDLRSAIQEAYAGRRAVFRRDISFPTAAGEERYLDVQVIPMMGSDAGFVGTKIDFVEMTRFRRLQEELQTSKHELETAYEELQSSNEELETTNEELQSSNEELETTNEELQSTNEELETMNEELQSTNEELETINTELRQRGEDLNHANALLKSILGGVRVGVAVIDQDLRVMLWNDRAEDLWGLRSDEVRGRHFMDLDIGLPVERLRQAIRACLSGESPQERVVLEARDRKGRDVRCEVVCTPLPSPEREIRGAILLMETSDERRRQA
jgi:two-component system, chemotaxis family, CheB/CheR fusion protein